jgi:hypothetical protein
VTSRTGFIASVLALAFVALSPAARADDPIKDIIDHKVPTLKDGTRIPIADVERALLDALARRKFEASVVSPGLISARFVHRWNSFEVSVPYTDMTYSVRYKDSKRMDYNEAKQRIDDSYNEWLEALEEHIQAQLESKLDQLKAAQKRARKSAKVTARNAA